MIIVIPAMARKFPNQRTIKLIFQRAKSVLLFPVAGPICLDLNQWLIITSECCFPYCTINRPRSYNASQVKIVRGTGRCSPSPVRGRVETYGFHHPFQPSIAVSLLVSKPLQIGKSHLLGDGYGLADIIGYPNHGDCERPRLTAITEPFKDHIARLCDAVIRCTDASGIEQHQALLVLRFERTMERNMNVRIPDHIRCYPILTGKTTGCLRIFEQGETLPLVGFLQYPMIYALR